MGYRPSLLLFNNRLYMMLFNRLVGPTYSLNTPLHKIYQNKYYYYDKDGVLPVTPIATKKWNLGENVMLGYQQGGSSGSTEWHIEAFAELGTSTFTSTTSLGIDVLDAAEAVIGTLGGWSENTNWDITAIYADGTADFIHSAGMTGGFSEYDGPLHGLVFVEDIDIEVSHTPQALKPFFSSADWGKNQGSPGPLRP